ncbi:hypothetical protein TNCT_438151 [Trichonephila clavata]|uniref:Uncharacterized protein n=1 Tax=Trichonephila clavata TaxID=2740835 RepID=A0A8X6KMG0_TRICU|nr:hypothetical protein TNCT_438151 [Trichonephila clavata]
MSTKGVRAIIKRFEVTGKLEVHILRNRKCVTLVLVDGIKTAVEVLSEISEFGGSSARAASRQARLVLQHRPENIQKT